MLCVAVSVSQLAMCLSRAVSEGCYLLPGEYNYPPLNGSEYYIPPRQGYPGDLKCDCNFVMYKYGVLTSQMESCADLPFGV